MPEVLINSLASLLGSPPPNPDATLNGAIDASTTSLMVTTLPGLVTTGQFRIRIDAEWMTVTAIGGTGNRTWTVLRGVGGSTAATHASGAGVYIVVIKETIENYVAESIQERFHSVKDSGAVGDGVADDTAAMQNSIANFSKVFIPEGTYLVDPDVLEAMDRSQIIGEGMNTTVLKLRGSSGGVILKPGRYDCRLDGFTIDGNNIAGTTGILCDDTNRPNQASWGAVCVKKCPVAGVKIEQPSNGGGVFYNNFGSIWVDNCGVGVWLLTDHAAPVSAINSNYFPFVRANTCTTGLLIDNASGNGFGFVNAEICTTGINVVMGLSNYIVGGWLEGNTTNIAIANNPDVIGFSYLGFSDQNITSYSYAESSNRSDLLSYKNGGQFICLAGRWFFDTLSARGSGAVNANNISLLQDSSVLTFGAAGDAFISRFGPRGIQIGRAPSASPAVDDYLIIGESARSGSDTNTLGGNGYFRSGAGTGNSNPTIFTFQTPHVGTSGTSGQGYENRLVLGDRLVSIPASNNLVIGAAGVGTSGVSVLGLGNGTEPSTSPIDMVQLYSVDLSAGNATLGLRTETPAAVDVGLASTHSLTVRINGAHYKIPLVAA